MSAAGSPPYSSIGCGRRSSCSPIRPSSMPGRRQGYLGPAHQTLRDSTTVALQHLCDRGPARRARSPIPAALRWKPPPIRRAPRPVLRCRRYRRACLYRNYDQHQKNVAKLRAQEKQIQNDTVEPADDAPPPAAAGAALPIATRRRRPSLRRRKSPPSPPARAPHSPPRRRRWFSASAPGKRPQRNSTLLEIVLRSRRSQRVSHPSSQRVFHDGAIEHDRFCPEQRRQRALYARMELKSVNAKALTCGCGCRRDGTNRGLRQEARR